MKLSVKHSPSSFSITWRRAVWLSLAASLPLILLIILLLLLLQNLFCFEQWRTCKVQALGFFIDSSPPTLSKGQQSKCCLCASARSWAGPASLSSSFFFFCRGRTQVPTRDAHPYVFAVCSSGSVKLHLLRPASSPSEPSGSYDNGVATMGLK